MEDIIAKSRPVLQKYHIRKASLFGSRALGDEKKESDVDILIKVPKNVTGFDYIGLLMDIREELEKQLHKKVDVVDFEAIKPSLKKYILSHQVAIMS